MVDIINQTSNQNKKDVIDLAEARFDRKLAQVETRIVRSMFFFLFGQFWMIVGSLIGVMFAFFNVYR